MEMDLCFNSVKHILEQIYLFYVFYSGCPGTAGLQWESSVFLQVFRIVSAVQEKMLIVTTRMFRASLIRSAPVVNPVNVCKILPLVSSLMVHQLLHALNLYTC